MPTTPEYDIVLAGGGLAGLSFALECQRHAFFRDKKILLIDRDDKQRNDRTWCFWAEPGEPLPPVLHKSWPNCRFFGPGGEVPMSIAPFQYHMVRGLDFYRHATENILKNPNVRWVKANIHAVDAASGTVRSDGGDFRGEWVLNSAFSPVAALPAASALYPTPAFSLSPGAARDGRFSWLLQHFKGWFIRSREAVFDPEQVTFMDYRIEQRGETRFVYVLPFSPTEALVEFTVFSPALCPAAEYDAQLRHYVHNFLKIKDFEILEEEFGVIPMTDHPFNTRAEGRLLHIGTAGGFVKASSGYAFKRTQRKIRAFVADWAAQGRPDPAALRSPRAFRLCDAVMLRVLQNGDYPGSRFFSGLFQALPAPLVFRFLDEDATFAQVLRVMANPPSLPFLKAVAQKMPVFPRV
jgi:lycopene beta-cyclase